MKKLVLILLVLAQSITLAQAQDKPFAYYRHQVDSLLEILERMDLPKSSVEPVEHDYGDFKTHRHRADSLIDLIERTDVNPDSIDLGSPIDWFMQALLQKTGTHWPYTGGISNREYLDRLEAWNWPDSANNLKLQILAPIILPYLEEQDRLYAAKWGIMHYLYWSYSIWIGIQCFEQRYRQLPERCKQISLAFENAAAKLSMPKDSLPLVQLIDSLCSVSQQIKLSLGLYNDDIVMIPLQAAQRIVLQKFQTPPKVYVRVLGNMAKLFWSGGTAYKLPNGKQITQEYIDAVKAYQPEDRKVNSDYYWSLLYLSRVYYYETFEYQKRVAVLKEVLELVESQLGKQNYTYTTNACDLAQAWQNVGRNDLAEPLFREAVAIERTLSARQENKDAGMGSLKKIFDFYFETQQYRKAEVIYSEIIEVNRKKDGDESLKYALDLKQLGILYFSDGQYPKADSFYTLASGIIEKVRGKKDMLYNQMLVMQGEMAARTGDFKKAEALYLEAKASMEELLQGKYDGWVNFGDYNQQTYDYPICLTSLALLYYYIGQYERADELYQTALQIYRTAKPSSKLYLDRQIASLLNSMGVNYWGWGKYDEAEKCFQESLTILEKTDGRQTANYLLPLHSLGDLYFSEGHYDKAEPVYQEVGAFWEKSANSAERYYLACARQYQAMVFENTGRATQAEPLFRAAKEDFAISKGKNHPEYAACLFSEGCYLARQGKTDLAIAALSEANSIEQGLVKNGCTYLSEGELQQLADKTRRSAGFIYSWLSKQNGKMDAALSALCYDNALFDKGFLLQARLAVEQAVAQADSNTQALFERWKDLQQHLAVQYTAAVRDSAYIAGLEVQANAMEKELTRQVAGLGQAQRQVTWQAVQQKLRPGEAALEFVQYQYVFPKNTDSTMYAALLLKPDSKQPEFIPLFEERQLDSLFGHTTVRKADYVNDLYTLADRGVTPVDAPHKSLYELIWQPLEKDMEGVKTVYFSPSGLLHRLNLGAIPIPVGEESLEHPTLADRYQLVQLGSTRAITEYGLRITDSSERSGQSVIPNLQSAILYGGIRYEMDSTALRQANTDLAARNITESRGLSFSYADTANRGGSWKYLPWTEVEVKGLEKILKANGLPDAVLHTGYTATEESFKRIGQAGPSPRILHLATHGYFFPDPKGMRSAEYGIRNEEGGVFKISEHPMIRSGLILAGANQVWKGGQPLTNAEDGILTAYEISQMNLSNTELVVLSACETGLGDIRGNEGVYGLQRAFKIAGAKYLIMSLWQVDDSATQELMTMFYTKWLEAKIPIPEAFRAAQQSMREKYRNQPYLWAGFVLVE